MCETCIIVARKLTCWKLEVFFKMVFEVLENTFLSTFCVFSFTDRFRRSFWTPLEPVAMATYWCEMCANCLHFGGPRGFRPFRSRAQGERLEPELFPSDSLNDIVLVNVLSQISQIRLPTIPYILRCPWGKCYKSRTYERVWSRIMIL